MFTDKNASQNSFKDSDRFYTTEKKNYNSLIIMIIIISELLICETSQPITGVNIYTHAF